MKREPRALTRPRSCQARHGSRGRNDRCGFQKCRLLYGV